MLKLRYKTGTAAYSHDDGRLGFQTGCIPAIQRCGSLTKQGVTEALKATNQMEWVRHMNSIRNRAEEIILTELVYA